MSILKKFFCLALAIFAVAALARQAYSYEPGDTLQFGNYPYGEDGAKQPISWILLEKYEDGTALLLTEKSIDMVKYAERRSVQTWETSGLRAWLNGYFFKEAFNEEEQGKIDSVRLENKDSKAYKTPGGNATEDKVFALSIDEAEKYGKKIIGNAVSTPYADSRFAAEAKKSKKKGKLSKRAEIWWLRSPGGSQEYAAYVSNEGAVSAGGRYVDTITAAVRPAIKVNLDKLIDVLPDTAEQEVLAEGSESAAEQHPVDIEPTQSVQEMPAAEMPSEQNEAVPEEETAENPELSVQEKKSEEETEPTDSPQPETAPEQK